MDQLKTFLAACKKYHFWILTGLTAILSIVGYFMARGKLASEYATRESALNGVFSEIQRISGTTSTHPNEFSHKQMDQIISVVTDDVRSAWEMQYDRQKDIFQWPIDALPPEEAERTKVLGLLDTYRPIELQLAFPLKDDPLDYVSRTIYRDYIKGVFPRLASIIGSEWKAEMREGSAGSAMSGYAGGMPGSSGGGESDDMAMGGEAGAGLGGGLAGGAGGGLGGGYGGMMGGSSAAVNAGAKSQSVVEWDSASQQELMDGIVSWYDPKSPPDTLQICYTQEDLWILEGILKIIAATNAGARENFQAAIKEIDFIRFGRTAMGQAGEIKGAGAGAGAGSGMPGMGGMGGMGMGGMGGAAAGGAGGGMGSSANPYGQGGAPNMGGGISAAPKVTRDPADNRYVDEKFNPITGNSLRTKMKSKAPGDAYYAVAKRIPVRMRFKKMDQRKLNKFLVECGNAQMILEVRQVRINCDPAPLGGGGGGAAGGFGGMMDGARPTLGSAAGSAGLDSDSGGAGYGGMLGGGGGTLAEAGSAFDIPVEIYGVIYLYNPVNIEMLGLKQVQADTKLSTTVEPTAGTQAAATQATATGAATAAPAGGAATTPPAAGGAAPAASGGAVPPPASGAAGAGAAPATTAPETPAGAGAASTEPVGGASPPAGGTADDR
jgi:hypothetical protein